MNLEALSEREEQVMRLMVDEGATPKEIAAKLRLNGNAVGVVMYRIREKLGAKTTIQAAAMWEQRRSGGNRPLEHPGPESLLRDFNTCATCRGLGFVRKPITHAVIGGQRA